MSIKLPDRDRFLTEPYYSPWPWPKAELTEDEQFFGRRLSNLDTLAMDVAANEILLEEDEKWLAIAQQLATEGTQ